MEIEEIIEEIKEQLSPKRFEHSMGTMKRMEELANRYHMDVETAKKVGIAHDIAKEMTPEESFSYLENHGIVIDEIERKLPFLLHAKIGAHRTKEKYGFDESMQQAISFHTVGDPSMDLLAKLLFVADKTEENRKEEKEDLKQEIELANTDIDACMIELLEKEIQRNIQKGKLIHPLGVITRNKLLSKGQ